ncbi:helix-hairpin-helix protein [Promicromonospora sp. AC04]|uniref:helix-hairpin-helix domain-containing protein n=1 Tax=Promicromonospora sp. AC04 TaxID=2135723 RepID=UPI000D3F5313|nr:helix-hairpin-helix domain-containing protein [Promicromonospora sp. AC04]PUB27161.1 helix-hairpin-helix protein [Promicromonospora sp. AC04]
MGWFIAQSLAFIIIAALIGLAIGIWIGWITWGRRAKGKHSAEKADAAARSAAAKSGSDADSKADSDAATETGAEADDAAEAGKPAADAEPAPVLASAAAATDETAAAEPAADSASDSDSDAETAVVDPEKEGAANEAEPAGSDVVAEAEAVARKAAEENAAAQAAAKTDAPQAAETPDNLRVIEGIGPKIEKALKAAGYATYAKIAGASEDELREAVASQGIKFAPSASSWADQAQYLVDSDADGLEEYQDYLVGGQERRAKFNENVDYADVDEIEGAEAKAEAIAEDEAEAATAEPEAAPEPEPEPEPQELQRIEGIGPKIETALKAAGYTTYAKVAGASEDELREALAAAGITFAPAATSWSDQAQYLVDGDEDGLREYQDYLIGGQDRASKFKEDVDYADVDEIEGAEAKAEAIAEDEAEAAAAEAEAAPEPEASAEPEPEPEPQDLQRIEGIGPKIESALGAAGYATYAKIAGATETELREALAAGGITFAPSAVSWAEQAQFLADGDEDGLQEFQDYLIGGQDRRAKFNEDVDYADVDEIEGAEAKAEAIAADEAETAAAEGDSEPTQSEVKA